MLELISKEAADGLPEELRGSREGAAVLHGATSCTEPEAKSNSLKCTTSEDTLFGL